MRISPAEHRHYHLQTGVAEHYLVLDGADRIVGPVTNPTGKRIAHLLDDTHLMMRHRTSVNCHGAAAYVLGQLSIPRSIDPVMPAGETLSLPDACATLELPFQAQLIDAQPGGVVVVHTAVIVATDTENGMPVVFHKPGREEYELRSWDDAIGWYQGLYKEVLFSGRKRK